MTSTELSNATEPGPTTAALSRYSIAGLAALLALAAGAASAQDYSSAVLADGPIGYWRLDETSGTNAVNIGSLGAAADGTYTGAVDQLAVGPPLDIGPGNTATGFGPGASSIQTGNPLTDSLSAFTYSAFINPADRLASRVGLFGQDNAIEFGFISPSVVQIWTPAIDPGLNVTYPFPSGEWHHVAAVGDGTDVRMYFDGVLVGTLPGVVADYGSSANGFNIGGAAIFGGDTQYTGVIDEVAVFTVALTQEQIQAHLVAASQATQIPTLGTAGLVALTLLVAGLGVVAARHASV